MQALPDAHPSNVAVPIDLFTAMIAASMKTEEEVAAVNVQVQLKVVPPAVDART
jgi:hypothetical protein